MRECNANIGYIGNIFRVKKNFIEYPKYILRCFVYMRMEFHNREYSNYVLTYFRSIENRMS